MDNNNNIVNEGNSKLLYLRGDSSRGNEVILLLEALGGVNVYNYNGTFTLGAYTIGNSGYILSNSVSDWMNHIFTLDEFKSKYRFNVGDVVLFDGDECIVSEMRWEECDVIYTVLHSDGSTYSHVHDGDLSEVGDSVSFIKETPIFVNEDNVKSDISRGCYDIELDEGYADEVLLSVSNDYKIIERDGSFYVVRRKPSYPTSFRKALEVLEYVHDDCEVTGYSRDVLNVLQRLIVCRDAWWKIDGNWKPDWSDNGQIKYSIISQDGKVLTRSELFVRTALFSFRTCEMRDMFIDVFGDELKKCIEYI